MIYITDKARKIILGRVLEAVPRKMITHIAWSPDEMGGGAFAIMLNDWQDSMKNDCEVISSVPVVIELSKNLRIILDDFYIEEDRGWVKLELKA